MYQTRQTGVSLVEVIIGVALIAGVLVVISQLMTLYIQSVHATQDEVVATYEAETTLEEVRAVRDTDWATFAALPLDTPLYTEYGASTLSLETVNPEPAAIFQTEIRLQTVYRDSTTDDIELAGGAGTYADTDARLVEVVVQKDGQTVIELETVFFNVFEI